MTDKSHVSMEQHVCLACARPFDTGAILLDRRLRQSLDTRTVTGWGLCPEHEALYQQGYIALVEADPSKGGSGVGSTMKPEDAYRTGRLAHLKEHAFKQLFKDVDTRTTDGKLCAVCFIDPDTMDYLIGLLP